MTPDTLAAAFLEPRARKLAALHPLVRAEVEAEVRWRAGLAKPTDASIKWQTDGPMADLAICVARVIGRLRREMFGKPVPSDHEILRQQREAACAAAGMTIDGRQVEQSKGGAA